MQSVLGDVLGMLRVAFWHCCFPKQGAGPKPSPPTPDTATTSSAAPLPRL